MQKLPRGHLEQPQLVVCSDDLVGVTCADVAENRSVWPKHRDPADPLHDGRVVSICTRGHSFPVETTAAQQALPHCATLWHSHIVADVLERLVDRLPRQDTQHLLGVGQTGLLQRLGYDLANRAVSMSKGRRASNAGRLQEASRGTVGRQQPKLLARRINREVLTGGSSSINSALTRLDCDKILVMERPSAETTATRRTGPASSGRSVPRMSLSLSGENGCSLHPRAATEMLGPPQTRKLPRVGTSGAPVSQ